MTSDPKHSNPTPSYPTENIPQIERALNFMFTMEYLAESPRTKEKNFFHEGDITSAQKRAREHCLKMGYRYVTVRKFISNLDVQEARKEHEQKD